MKFQPGVSGNPGGRRVGSGVVGKLRKSIEKHIPVVLEAMIIAAKGGDTHAAKLLLERVVPQLRPVALPAATPTQGSLADRAEAVMQALSAGTLTPIEGNEILGVYRQVAELSLLQDLERRLTALEVEHESEHDKKQAGTVGS